MESHTIHLPVNSMYNRLYIAEVGMKSYTIPIIANTTCSRTTQVITYIHDIVTQCTLNKTWSHTMNFTKQHVESHTMYLTKQ